MGQPTQRATNYTARSNIEPAQICLHAFFVSLLSGDIDLESYRTFCTKTLFSRVKVQALCHGNATAEQAEDMVARTRTAIGETPLTEEEQKDADMALRAMQLPEAREVCIYIYIYIHRVNPNE